MDIAELVLRGKTDYDGVYAAGYAAGQADAPNPLLYVTKLQGTYVGVVFPDGYELKLVMPNYQGNMTNAFYGVKGIRKVTLDVPTNIAYEMYGLVRENSIEELVLPDGINITSWNYFGYLANNLRKIIGRINLSGSTSNGAALNNTRNLEEVYFMPGTIEASINIASTPNLIDTSIQSIIDGLAQVETTQTLTLRADVGARLTETQKEAAAAKNWTLVY